MITFCVREKVRKFHFGPIHFFIMTVSNAESNTHFNLQHTKISRTQKLKGTRKKKEMGNWVSFHGKYIFLFY